MTTILASKLFIPPLRPNAVPRPRLLAHLNHGISGKLTLVTAPAGFGKTTLITAWLAQLPGEARQAAWLSLDENDSSPARFFTYLLAALQHASPGFAQHLLDRLQAPQLPNLDILAGDLLNELAAAPRPLVIVLDDFHVISNSTLHSLVNTLVDYAPPRAHFAITSRDQPPLDLPRWRVRGQLTEVNAAGLRFTTPEARSFLTTTMGLDLPEEAVTALEDRTEGWVAGLQLAALSLRAAPDSGAFIDGFTGRDRKVADYLLTEVLDRQPPGITDFLLRTAVLDRFNAALCAALLDIDENQAQERLAASETTDLFIVPLDNERRWYRYHHLFAQLLRQRLENTRPAGEVSALRRRAAAWYHAQDLIELAVPQALQAGDPAYAARLITEIPLTNLWESYTGGLVQQWAGQLPEDAIRAHPRAAIWITFTLMLRGEIDALQSYLALIAGEPAVDAERSIFESILARNNGRLDEALQLAQFAAENLPPDDLPLRTMAVSQAANCLIELGRLDEAENTIDGLRAWLPINDPALLNLTLDALDLQGTLAKARGNYYQAAQHFQESLALIENHGTATPQLGMIWYQLSALHYQWNELDSVETWLTKADEWGRRTGVMDILLNTALGFADLAAVRGDTAAALEAFTKFQEYTSRAGLASIRTLTRALEAHYNLRLGRLEPAIRWANASGLSFNDRPGIPDFAAYQIFAAVRLAEARTLAEYSVLPGLLRFLDGFIRRAEAASHAHYLLRTLILRALTLDLQGETRAAVTTLHRALELAEPGSILRVFIDYGAPMQQLLENALSHAQAPDMRKRLPFIRRLLLALEAETGTAPASPPSPELPSPLTPRELEILRLIAAGLSNRAIQEKLHISNNTVRTHIKNLYSKLDVTSRTQAVLRAQQLHIL